MTDAPGAAARTVPELLGKGRDDAPAIGAPGRRATSFAELRGLVDDTVESLNALGIGRNDRVAIVLPNGPAMATAFVSIAAGATTAPLNPTYRTDEYDFYLGDLGAKALVVERGSSSPAVEVAQRRGVPVIQLVEDHSAGRRRVSARTGSGLRGRPGARRARRTGRRRPRAAHVRHHLAAQDRAAEPPQRLRLRAAHRGHAGAWARRRLPQRDAAVPHPRPDRGGVVVARRRRVGSLHARFQRAQILRLARGGVARPGTPPFRPCTRPSSPERTGIGTSFPGARLRFIRSSSASLPPQVMAALEEAFGAPVIESYGMTEASHQMTSNPLPPRARKPGSVGVAAGPEVAIMSEDGAHPAARRTRRDRHPRTERDEGLRGESGRQREGLHRRLVPHRRPGRDRRGGLSAHHGAAQGADQPRRREGEPARGRRGADGPPGGAAGRDLRRAAREARGRGRGGRGPAREREPHRARAARFREGPACRLQGARAASSSSRRSRRARRESCSASASPTSSA